MLAVASGSRLFSMSLAAMWENPGVLAIALGQKVGGKRPCSTGALLFLRERQSVQTAVAQGIGERFTPRHAGTHHKARPPRAQQGHPTPPRIGIPISAAMWTASADPYRLTARRMSSFMAPFLG